MGDTIADSQQTAQGNVGTFVARTAVGLTVGFFRSAREAQAAIEQTSGNLLNWTQSNLPGQIEFWIGADNT